MNVARMTAEHLVPLPEPRLRQLFKLMDPIMTFVHWQVLADAVYINTSKTDSPHNVKPFQWKEEIDPEDLPKLIQTMQPSSGSIHFLTILDIKNTEKFNTRDLLLLSDLRSLVILRMEDNGLTTTSPSEFGCYRPSMNLNDTLIRGWSEKHHPFPSLRSLTLITMPGSLSAHMLRYASKFPNLQVVHVNSPLTNPRPTIGQPLSETPAWTPEERRSRPCWDASRKYDDLGLDNPHITITVQPPVQPGQVDNKSLFRSLSEWRFARNWNMDAQDDVSREKSAPSATRQKRKAESTTVRSKNKRKIGDLLGSFGGA
ncbi:hypothetical protein B0T21DRAFT_294664 [Apiosordaria backusii]|uniref:Uncharacterized protein n=1 Tax=Apiosordaria backusii TaxID=314023 RepID=A0AA40AT18_9PEZI|nr:hypothetical protein B0T21DRAFT_294664 [Apiosordaria backusii]